MISGDDIKALITAGLTPDQIGLVVDIFNKNIKEKRQSNAERVRKHRERTGNVTLRNACNVTDVTPPDGPPMFPSDSPSFTPPIIPPNNIVGAHAQKGTRLSLERPPAEWLAFCKAERPELDPAKVFDGFRDYWTGIPGGRGRKVDWLATWRNWVRNQKHGPPKPYQRAAEPERIRPPDVRFLPDA